MPSASALYACDRNWWHAWHAQACRTCEGAEFWTCNREASRIYDLHFIDSEAGGGFSKRPGTIRQGGNSGFQALALALHFGAARVVLLGYDMQHGPGKQKHWHADHGGKLHNPQPANLRAWPIAFAQLARQTQTPIVNATRETALQCFPRIDLADALAG